jgi:hypothetical protein
MTFRDKINAGNYFFIRLIENRMQLGEVLPRSYV